ncbi:MAG: 2-succinyl-5-enolpyruvyl-6-hydroxy-3-cyclohexene-1-carboxylic-acid synthase [Firmicutes bacterium]|nr:2-succinyl-5-enolpyruvyl-6-hydroxy-3-cyclohexene-1-carboxylic-acid synthase [Bacillota bacterium]MCM1401424.1 2-succinyl-5-enolpyruvyl-6-hydroxy-3-cyclohexene-1-carboxylic-acid synthase [Bacteroides sp.]MCM1477306.1 2-succinyl-5-enolpyruvyl-6-hydroxy-3-cyclohexene-1-carboxylic-acid synthase [Bacteroides sp.]
MVEGEQLENTAQFASKCIVDLMRKAGIRQAIACPGSRNTPLLLALSRCPEITTRVVVDERSAAFIALGMASISMEPVAVVCTSGTALLNLAPAVAEAYYRKIPLIVVSADRPMAWIDQDDSQTIRQFRALDNFVKKSYDIPDYDNVEMRWYANRIVNDALIECRQQPMGPVHINVQIGEPVGALAPHIPSHERFVTVVSARNDIDVTLSRQLGCELASPKKVMIVAGFCNPDPVLNKALNRLSRLPNFIVLTETIANLHGDDFVSDIDATLSSMTLAERKELQPDVVISLGGSIVSRFIKKYLREAHPAQHWHVGHGLTTVDCFQSLTKRIEVSPGIFFRQLASAMQPHQSPSDYGRKWRRVRDASRSLHQSFIASAPWCDLKAFATFLPMIPRNCNIQLSNGTPVRYAQLLTARRFHRCDCNRGVSGIDGSTSTAIGASLTYKAAPTILITGDMSAQYDVGALGSGLLSPRFKMIVMCNGGGGIFHFICTTRSLDIVEQFFDKPCSFPAKELAQAYNMAFFEAESEDSLRSNFPHFMTEMNRPSMLAIKTSGQISGKVLTEYFSTIHP